MIFYKGYNVCKVFQCRYYCEIYNYKCIVCNNVCNCVRICVNICVCYLATDILQEMFREEEKRTIALLLTHHIFRYLNVNPIDIYNGINQPMLLNFSGYHFVYMIL